MNYPTAKSRLPLADPTTSCPATHMDAMNGRSSATRARMARRERLMHKAAAALEPTWGLRSYSIAATVVLALEDELGEADS